MLCEAFRDRVKPLSHNLAKPILVAGVAALLLLAAVGAVTTVKYAAGEIRSLLARRQTRARIPISKLPGPGRAGLPQSFKLDEQNSQRMQGMNDPANERWADVAGNYYTSSFISQFSYENTKPGGPVVRVRIAPEAPTLKGRLEAQGLKPNFAYQIKLRGDFTDRDAFEAIGYAGRWRLPGRATNYTDDDYRACPDKENVEAYLLFDYFVTDRKGNAVRVFALDSCLHVLWNAFRQHPPASARDILPVIVDSTSPSHYARPKAGEPRVELLWAERERSRYRNPAQSTFLPPGPYRAELVLTEESFHSRDNDGGWWATVYVCPIEFTITPPPTNTAPSRD